VAKRNHQPGLFADATPLPAGFRYEPQFLSGQEELELLRQIERLPFESFQFHGFLAKRRVVSFGWQYDFNDRELRKADDLPAFLLPLRQRAAAFAGLGPGDLQHALVIEYAPGAGIGWHRDRPAFGDVIGVSLLAPARLRFRRKRETGWERRNVMAEPRSAYLLRGPARSEWEHSIPPMEELRYSITFRTLTAGGS
jgi:alkylated DNA repair dioxygenase AlkB